MENRHGLLIDLAITDATLSEPKAATPMLDRRRLARRGRRAWMRAPRATRATASGRESASGSRRSSAG